MAAKNKKFIPVGEVHIHSTFNNTIISVTDQRGNVIAWSSTGANGFKGSRKSTPYAAQVTADKVASSAAEVGLRTICIRVKGPGAGREAAIRAFANKDFNITSIIDVTPIPHNGTRKRKRRRV
ncbi:30S ribosomal subunit protein S11 [Alphaproteobacteria bacterium]